MYRHTLAEAEVLAERLRAAPAAPLRLPGGLGELQYFSLVADNLAGETTAARAAG